MGPNAGRAAVRADVLAGGRDMIAAVQDAAPALGTLGSIWHSFADVENKAIHGLTGVEALLDVLPFIILGGTGDTDIAGVLLTNGFIGLAACLHALNDGLNGILRRRLPKTLASSKAALFVLHIQCFINVFVLHGFYLLIAKFVLHVRPTAGASPIWDA